MLALDRLSIRFANGMKSWANLPFIRTIAIGIELCNPKRLQQCFQLQKRAILMVRQYIRQYFPGLMVNCMPQPALLFLGANETPHLIHFRFYIFPLAEPNDGLSGFKFC